jgi:cytochrome c-type biogenesis protein CcmH/NrfG
MWWPLILIVLLLIHPGIGTAQQSAEVLTVKALEECDFGRRSKEREVRLAHFKRSQSLAEQALALNDRLAGGHFALFCSLGEQLRIDGETSLSSVFGFRRMMKALNRTLELDPEHLDALSSKGTFLVRLPTILGGDKQTGERILRRVIRREPKAVNARLTLAKTYAARGDRKTAILLVTEALQIARSEQREDLIPEAQAALTELRPAGDSFPLND